MFPIKQYYPNFLRHSEAFPESKVLSLFYQDCAEWYNVFLDRILSALENHEYLPIYRISHGEFIMALGYRLHPGATLREIVAFYGFSAQRLIGIKPKFYSGSKDNSYEKFTSSDLRFANKVYLDAMREVAENGILAISFYLHQGFVSYINPYKKWLRDNSIVLNKENYFSFYMVYALLTGPDARKLLKDRNVLVVSSFTERKTEGLGKAFKEFGVAQVYYYNVSASRAIFDKIDIGMLPFRPDIVLVAAGVGTANVILQLRPINSVILDCGFALDALAFPEKRWHRPYCIDDSIFDLQRVKFLPKSGDYFLYKDK